MQYPVFFARVPSQIKTWHEKGGCIVSWNRQIDVGPHDAMILVQAPRMVRLLYRDLQQTRHLAIIARRYRWEPFIEKIRKRKIGKHPAEMKHALEEIHMMRRFVEDLPVFTPSCLPLIPPFLESSQSSCAPAQPAVEARVVDKPD